MSWPLSHEFNEAVQNPQVVFSDPDLKGGETVVGATGLPLPRSGNFADVYQVRGADGREWAVKCFTRPVAGLAERYAKVSAALAKAELPFTVGFTYLAEGIRVGGAWRPVVKMEWVEGLLLNQVARENAGKQKVLTALGQMWVKLCKRLREARVAHADVQHGNVLLVPGSRAGAYGLKLIDYDGMWVSELANTPSGESGHPSYQHPARAATRTYSPDVDRFPHLAVATALRGLSVGGSALWEKYDNGDNVLFIEGDYKKPSESALMKNLWHAGDPVLQALVGRLAIACGKPVPQTPWLDHIAPEGDPSPLDDATRREAADALGISLPVPVTLPPEPTFELPPPPAPAPAPKPVPIPAFTVDPKPMFPVEPEPTFTVDPEPQPLPEPPPQVRSFGSAAPARAAALEPVVVFDEEEHDVELIEDRRPGKRKPQKPRPKAAGWSNTRIMLFAGGGLLLLLGGVIAGVLIGKPKPTETVQKEEPKPVPPSDGPKPKDKLSDPIVPKPKDKVTDPLPSPPRPPGERFNPQQMWLVEEATALFGAPPLCGRDSRTALVHLGDRGQVRILDLETGKPLQSPTEAFDGAMAVALDGGRFANGRRLGQKDMEVWDPREGKVIEKLSARGLVSPGLMFVSPTGKYVGITTNNGTGAALQTVQIKDIARDTVIVDEKWLRGTVFFTDDESRVLVADATGRCRWYKLPSGELEREWTIKNKGPDNSYKYRIMAASGDGSALVYYGTVAERELAIHVLDGNTGSPRLSTSGIPSLDRPPSLTRDGRYMLVRMFRADRSERGVVFDVATGAVVADFAPPPGYSTFLPVLLPDGRGAVATAYGTDRRAVVMYDFGRGGVVAVKPPDPPPVVPVPAEPLVLKPRWAVQSDEHMYALHMTASGKTVLGGANNNRPGAAFDAATGAVRPEFAAMLKDGAHDFFPLSNGRVGKWQHGPFGRTITLWDEQTGKDVGKIDLPNPVTPKGGFPMTGLSPNGRFVVYGFTQTGAKSDQQFQLHVLDRDNKNKEVLRLDWPGGTVYFTADSARVLVAERSGRCRWYRLPSGEPDGAGWDFGEAVQWRQEITSISADGSILGFIGVLDGRLTAASVDGKTGAVVQRFRITNTNAMPVISPDGRRIAVPRSERLDGGQVDLADTRTGAVLGRIATPGGWLRLNFSQDSATLMLATREPNTVQVFDVPGAVGAPVVPVPPKPGAVVELKRRWSVEIKTDLKSGWVSFDADGQTIAIAGNGVPWAIAAADARTGELRNDLTNLKGSFYRLFPLEKGKIAYQDSFEKQLIEWDPKSGKTTAKPFTPPIGAGGRTLFVNLSPNGRYIAVGHPRAGPGEKEHPETQLRVIDTTTKATVLTANWHVGTVAFTADSSRVLVVDDTDRFRWFKLPSTGKPDAEWTFDHQANGFNADFRGMSAKGEVILFHGSVPGKDQTFHLLSGKDGTVLYSFPAKRYHPSWGAVSEDGQYVVLVRNDGFGIGHTVEVLDARGTLIANSKLPAGGNWTVGMSWKGRALAIYGRDNHQLTTYDLPDPPPK